MTSSFLDKHSDKFYFLFRVLIGFTFLLHGIMKWPGMLSGKTAIFTLFWFAGVIETIAGVFLILGLFVRQTSVVASLEMLVAYFYIHVKSKGTLHPLQNGGEAALLFFAAFLVLMAHGAGRWGIDKKSSK